MNAPPLVSIIIPCRNEEAFVARCLDSILANDYPTDRLEVLVVDGMSRDRTRAIVRQYSEEYGLVRLLDNPRSIIPAAMNIGIRNACGDIIVKMDAHSTYSNDYISMCVHFLGESGADNVGGVLVTRPRDNTAIGHAIALALGHPLGSGNAHFRVGLHKPRWSDTAAFGCYRKDVFKRVGLYNEELVRSSDMDLNARLRRAGGKILLVPQIVAYYYPHSRLGEFFMRNIVDGFWALYPLRFGGRGVRPRHLVPLACLLIFLAALVAATSAPGLRWVLPALLGLYVATTLAVSVHVVCRERNLWLLVLLPIAFGTRHMAYSIGSLWGIMRAVLSPSFWSNLRTGSRSHEATM